MYLKYLGGIPEENSEDLDTMTVYGFLNLTEDPDNKGFTFESFDIIKTSVLVIYKYFYKFSIHLQLEVNFEKSWCYAFGPYTRGTQPVDILKPMILARWLFVMPIPME